MFYQVSMSCQVCNSLFSYPVACEETLVTELRKAREACPYCGALMSPYQVTEVSEPQGIVSEWRPQPSQVTESPTSSPYWRFRQVAGSAVGSRCRHWRYRGSEHSPTGLVLEAAFDSFARAQTFAARWAERLPQECKGVKVRKHGRFWLAPVPFEQQVEVSNA